MAKKTKKTIVRQEDLPADIQAELEKYPKIRVGGLYFSRRGGEFVVIDGVEWSKHHENTLIVKYHNISSPKRQSTSETREFLEYYEIVDLEGRETPNQAVARLEKETSLALQDPSVLQPADDGISTDTSIVAAEGDKGKYTQALEMLDRQRRKVDAIRAIAAQRISQLNSIANRLQEQMRTVQQILDMLQLYLGVNEEIVVLRSGAPAGENVPISVRQLTLAMDEEAGILSGGGIDYTRVDEFDKWLLEGDHLQAVLPEEKGLVALVPSRQRRDYSDNVWVNAAENAKNAYTYLLIRNGEQVYRVYPNIVMGRHFFPTREEDQHLAQLFTEASNVSAPWDLRDAKDARALYLRNALLLQGLLDRTDVFQPVAGGRIDLFSPTTFEDGGPLRMIRDGENTLADGRLPFHDWRKQINDQVKRGSRIVVPPSNFGRYDKSNYYLRRFDQRYVQNKPEPPEPGTYSVEEVYNGERGYKVRILYRPRHSWAGYQTQKRISFKLYGDEYLAYDQINIEDVEYYINSRAERVNYLDVLPVLLEIRERRQKELEGEKGFIALLSQRTGWSEEEIAEAVTWWKGKVIFNRPLSKDDAKAWRMIKGYLKRKHGAG